MVQRNLLEGSENAAKFDALLELLIGKFNGKLFYHEIIGILQMQITGLTLEAYGLTDDEEEDDDDWGNLIGSADDE